MSEPGRFDGIGLTHLPVDIVNATGSGVAKLSHQCPIWLEAEGIHQDAFTALHERRLEKLLQTCDVSLRGRRSPELLVDVASPNVREPCAGSESAPILEAEERKKAPQDAPHRVDITVKCGCRWRRCGEGLADGCRRGVSQYPMAGDLRPDCRRRPIGLR